MKNNDSKRDVESTIGRLIEFDNAPQMLFTPLNCV
jgi:hypothetical protein